MNTELREEDQDWRDKIGYTCFWDLATFIFWSSKWMIVREEGPDWQDKTETMFLDLATFIFSSNTRKGRDWRAKINETKLEIYFEI